jgi:hypothetical protein
MTECVVPMYTYTNGGQCSKVEYVTEETDKHLFDDATQKHVNTKIDHLRQMIGKRHVYNLDQRFIRLYQQMIGQYGDYTEICINATLKQMATELLM